MFLAERDHVLDRNNERASIHVDIRDDGAGQSRLVRKGLRPQQPLFLARQDQENQAPRRTLPPSRANIVLKLPSALTRLLLTT